MRNTVHNKKNFFSLNLEFLILVGILICINIHYLRKTFVPICDTYFGAQVFHYIYNSFVVHSDLPAWIPYGIHGTPINWFQLVLTPANYMIGFLGFCSGVQDTLILFKLSVVLEQFIFLIGLYKLCRAIFISRSAVFLVCVAAECSTAWYWAIYFNFHTYYLLPFAIHSLLAFFRKEEPSYFWAAGIFFVLSLVGGISYCSGLYLLIATVFSLSLYLKHKRAILSLFSLTKKNIFFFSLFLLIAVFYYNMSKDVFASNLILSSGRDSSFGAVPFREFLSYGNDRVPPLYGFLVGWPPNYWGASHYVGLLPIVLAIWAFIKARTPTSVPFLSVLFILFWLFSYLLFNFFSLKSSHHRPILWGW